MPDALLVLVHGSPTPDANAPMFRVVEALTRRPDAARAYPIVEVGFMECNEPTIPQAIERCVEKGAGRVVAVPYFLHTGAHVCEDLPTLLEAAQREYPQVEFRMGDYLGQTEVVTGLLARRAEGEHSSPIA